MTEKTEKVNKSQIDFLKPCPFCGSDAVFKSGNATKDLNPRVECTKCSCIVLGVSEDDAIESWNRRVRE